MDELSLTGLIDSLDVTNMDIADLESRNQMFQDLGDSDLNLLNIGGDIGAIFESIDTGDVMTFLIVALVILLFILLMILSGWKIFEKAQRPGWEVLIPHHNIVVVLQIIGKPTWWWFLIAVPFVNIILGIYMIYLLVKTFGYDVPVTLGVLLLPFIFIPWLAYGKATYTPAIKHSS